MARNLKSKTSFDRAEVEGKENYRTEKTDMPGNRFSETAQVSTALDTTTTGGNDAAGDKTGSDGITPAVAKTVKSKMSIKPVSDVELSDGKQMGGVPLEGSVATMSAAGAGYVPNGAAIARDQSRMPYSAGGERAGSRHGRIVGQDNFVLNNTASESIDPKVSGVTDLYESADKKQGYIGRKQFNTARGKKIYGVGPQSMMYDRSIDFKGHSFVVATSGQVVGQVEEGSGYDGLDFPTDIVKSNYLVKGFTYDLVKSDGVFYIRNPHFVVDRIDVPITENTAPFANMNWQVDANNVTRDVIKLQTELGRETTEKWSPLGYVIDHPYQLAMLVHDIEATTGALCAASYKAATTSLAFMQNVLAKAGSQWGLIFIDTMFNETYIKHDGFQDGNPFAVTHCRSGSAAAMIKIFDSVNKYTTIADFFNQQRSLKFHLQSLDNNINTLHAKKEFLKAYDKAMMFSTEDGQYNPVSPIHYTEQVQLILPYDPNIWLAGWDNPHSPVNDDLNKAFPLYLETGLTTGVTYDYSDLRNVYTQSITDPFIAGLMRWMLKHERRIVEAYTTETERRDGDSFTVNLPMDFGMASPNMFAFMVCSAAQDMNWMRNIIFKDYLFAGDMGVYVWSDLASLKEVNPLGASQYGYSDYGSPLRLGKMANVMNIRDKWPEVISQFRAERGVNNLPDAYASGYILPWYFNEEQINIDNPELIDYRRGATMSYPSIRSGVNNEFVDVIQSIGERELRLSLDKMATLPVLMGSVGDMDATIEGYPFEDCRHYVGSLEYADVAVNSLRYDTNSDGRVILSTINGLDKSFALREITYLATPRELGFLWDMPHSLSRPLNVIEASGSHDLQNFVYGQRSDTLKIFRAHANPLTNAIDRSICLSQDFNIIVATPTASNHNNWVVGETGVIPALAAAFDVVARNDNEVREGISFNSDVSALPCIYQLRSNALTVVDGEADTIGFTSMHSLAPMMWVLLQRYYTPINVFECAFEEDDVVVTGANAADITVLDPLETAFFFGLAGFLASDYEQDILARLNTKDQLQMFYYKDEFLESSPLLNS